MQYRRIGTVVRVVRAVACVLVLSACHGNNEPSSQALRNDNPLTLSGSIGDGPVVGAAVSVLDANGDSVVAGVSDDAAGYEITVPVGTRFPITVTATGGTDLVTGAAPQFDLKAVLLDPTISHVNVSPLSTLALAIARCGGRVTNASVADAWTTLLAATSMGLDATRVPDPTHGAIDANNVADFVLANEALAETLRRTQAALAGTSSDGDLAAIIERLGCDLTDGVVDGMPSGADARTAATFSAASVGTALEVIAGKLEVDGADAMAPMDAAIRTIMPNVDASVTTASVPVTDALVKQANDALAVAMSALPDDALLDYSILLASTTAADARTALNAALTNADLVTFDGLAARVAASDDTQIATLTQAQQQQTDATVPIVSIAVNPASISAGGTTVLSWSSNAALKCKASGGWNGSQATSGSQSEGPLQASQTYTLSCVGLGGTTTGSTNVQVAAAPPPTAPVTTLTANPTSVTSGGSTTLTWSATNATGCTASGGWSGSKATSGTQSVGPLTANASFSLNCSGAGGSNSATATVTVQQPAAAPTLNLAASPTSVSSGGSSTLTWSSTNATSCTASGDWTGTQAVSGTMNTGALTTAKSYTLACSGAGGSVTKSVSVAIVAPSAPTLTFTASPMSVASGSSSQLTWSTTNATSCTASGAWSGSRATSGTQSTGALSANATYTLSCTGAGGTVNQSVAVALLPAPTLTFSASPTSVQSGASSTLTWTATNATACTASGSWSGSKATSGTQSTGALTANGSYTLTCTGTGGSVAQTVAVAVLPAPTLTLSASPASVAAGSASTLMWSTTNANSCTASGGWSGSKATSGSQSTGALNANTTFSLTCTGAGGSVTQSASVSILPAPTVTLSASPTSVASGAASTLTWSTTNATACTASGSWSGSRATSGTASTGALTANASYTLTCTGGGGSASQTVGVTLLAAPTVSLTASPMSVASGSSSTLTWSSTNATSCTASGSWSGSRATSGTFSTGALTANASYTLSCTGAGGSASQTASVTVAPVPTVSVSASPTSVASGAASTLTWSSTNATSCTASGAWSGSRTTSGTQSTGALTGNSTFTLTCTGSGGSASQSAAVTVTAASPTATLTANPRGVAANGSTTLTWSSTNATSCAASGAWSGALATSGSQSVGPITGDSTYTLTCSGAGGNAVAMTTVSLRQAVFSWTAPTKNTDGSNLTNLTGYKIYYGTSPGNYTQSVTVTGASTTSYTLPLSPGTYYFALTAVDSTGAESARTGELTKTVN